jgi:hypothetical protein
LFFSGNTLFFILDFFQMAAGPSEV